MGLSRAERVESSRLCSLVRSGFVLRLPSGKSMQTQKIDVHTLGRCLPTPVRCSAVEDDNKVRVGSLVALAQVQEVGGLCGPPLPVAPSPGQTAAIDKPPPRRSANFQALWWAVSVGSGAQREIGQCPTCLGRYLYGAKEPTTIWTGKVKTQGNIGCICKMCPMWFCI